MRVLITGATGFVGGHLAEALLARGDEVSGLNRRPFWPAEWRHLEGRVPVFGADLVVSTNLGDALADLRPDWIIHLAGYAHAGQSFREPDRAWTGNLETTRRLYDAVAK